MNADPMHVKNGLPFENIIPSYLNCPAHPLSLELLTPQPADELHFLHDWMLSALVETLVMLTR